jgi:hypothetical protein
MANSSTAFLNAKIKEAKTLLQSRTDFPEGLRILRETRDLILDPLDLGKKASLYGSLFDGLTESDYHAKVNKKGRTIAYGIWHSSRIEDMTLNALVLHQAQVFDRTMSKESVLAGVRDTGNQLDAKEIQDMSRRMDISCLILYQRHVWSATNAALSGLTAADLSRKVDRNDVEGLLEDGSVSRQPDAAWLIDFWANKTVAGLLMMPMCRHQIVHLNESMEAKHAR